MTSLAKAIGRGILSEVRTLVGFGLTGAALGAVVGGGAALYWLGSGALLFGLAAGAVLGLLVGVSIPLLAASHDFF